MASAGRNISGFGQGHAHSCGQLSGKSSVVVRIILWILAIQVIELLAFLLMILVWPQAVSSPLRADIIVTNMLIGNAATTIAFWKVKTKQPPRHDYFVITLGRVCK